MKRILALVDVATANLKISAHKVSKLDSLLLPEHETKVDHHAPRGHVKLWDPLTCPTHQPLQGQENNSFLQAPRKDEVEADASLEDWS